MPNYEEVLETMNSSNSHISENITKSIDDEMDTQMMQETVKEEFNDTSQGDNDQNDFPMMDDVTTIRNEDENSQDSLLQHMKDMFCESDDSSDITKLIEKHSGVTKANIDKEINKICLEADSNLFGMPQNDNIPKSKIAKVSTSKGKVSFSRYKEMQNRKANKSKETNGNEIGENKQKQRLNAIWFVERVHQVSQLKAKMTELSLTNYRKHGKIKEQFLELFGECEEEEMMPESPICIEDYLPACKERIAPWIVKYLMPFYKKRRIKDRQLFKIVAKYIADMLIIENTFPGNQLVSCSWHNYISLHIFIRVYLIHNVLFWMIILMCNELNGDIILEQNFIETILVAKKKKKKTVFVELVLQYIHYYIDFLYAIFNLEIFIFIACYIFHIFQENRNIIDMIH